MRFVAQITTGNVATWLSGVAFAIGLIVTATTWVNSINARLDNHMRSLGQINAHIGSIDSSIAQIDRKIGVSPTVDHASLGLDSVP